MHNSDIQTGLQKFNTKIVLHLDSILQTQQSKVYFELNIEEQNEKLYNVIHCIFWKLRCKSFWKIRYQFTLKCRLKLQGYLLIKKNRRKVKFISDVKKSIITTITNDLKITIGNTNVLFDHNMYNTDYFFYQKN